MLTEVSASPYVGSKSLTPEDASEKRGTDPVIPEEEDENCLSGLATNLNLSKLSSVSLIMAIDWPL